MELIPEAREGHALNALVEVVHNRIEAIILWCFLTTFPRSCDDE